ncbi:MAG: DUF4231 domain-containing protein [Candidatus Lokiarchaeota archaeon]|nr:DUF4231 domain-containing protein [Candidatus Lokiarchaeota archaeon]
MAGTEGKPGIDKLDETLDLNYTLPEYNESAYLYNAEWGGADKILQIEKQFDEQGRVFDADFDVFWRYYIKNLVDFDAKANAAKRRYQKLQFFAIVFTIITPQVISFMSMLDWGSIGGSNLLVLLVAIPVTFLTALLVSILSLKKYEQLFTNYRSACEKLKSASYKFQFSAISDKKERKNEFMKHVIQIIEEHLAGFEGIFAK